MAMAQTAALAGNPYPVGIVDLSGQPSREASELLMRAVSSVDRDEAAAVDFVRKASALLRPNFPMVRRPDAPSTGGLAPWQVKRLHSYIAENLAKSISLQDMAQLVRLSTSYFSAAFKISFGVSPHSYLVGRRVEFAKQRMLHSSAPLCEIALDCGLSDQAHLSRVFRKMTGTTPSAWRRYRRHPEAIASVSV